MTQTIRMTLAAARVNAGLTQKQVCDAIGISLPTLCMWERGYRSPKVDNAIKLAKLYNVPLENINFAKKVESN